MRPPLCICARFLALVILLASNATSQEVVTLRSLLAEMTEANVAAATNATVKAVSASTAASKRK